jgi:hypothetical protein
MLCEYLKMCVCIRERETENEREKEREKQGDRDTKRQREIEILSAQAATPVCKTLLPNVFLHSHGSCGLCSPSPSQGSSLMTSCRTEVS